MAARIDGKATNIRARRGVVLAAGGFACNAEMVNLFVPHQAQCVVYSGAGSRDVVQIKGTFGFHPDTARTPGRDWSNPSIASPAVLRALRVGEGA